MDLSFLRMRGVGEINMIKISVKKPYLILVFVVIIMMLAGVSLTRMTTDLYPSISTPYMMVITTYPGASPEKVEIEVTEPVESVLSTVNQVDTYTSQSAENYSITMLEFQDDADMNAALVNVYTSLETIKDSLPENCGDPSVMELSMDMLATMYVSISADNMDIYELTDYVNEEIEPYFQRVSGVANVSALGLVDEMIEVKLNEEKIDSLNDELAASVSDSLADAKKKLDDAQSDINSGKDKLDDSKDDLTEKQEDTSEELAKYTKQLNEALATQKAYDAILTSLNADKTALEAELAAYQEAGVQSSYDAMNKLFAGLQTTLSDTATAAYIGFTKEQVPADITEALSDSTKLANAVAVLNATGQQEVAASLTAENLQKLSDIVDTRIPQINTELANLATEIAANTAAKTQVDTAVETALEKYEEVEAGKITAASAFGSGFAQIASSQSALTEAQESLDSAMDDYEEARDAALEQANLDQLLTLDTLSKLIAAQNFEMPAGYISQSEGDSEDEDQWLLKVGTEIESQEELESTVLTHIDKLGDITVSDIADITLIDNAEDSYCRMNGEKAVLLSIYKASTAGTSAVAAALNETIDRLEAKDESLHIDPLMDQGEYITMFLDSIVGNMIQGALLAVIVLIIFLRSPKPTLIAAFSIPFSVLLAILVMYFTGITLNLMSMAGLALGIGMLVDNSIVVIENIYRLRGTGMSSVKAAVLGSGQVSGAIISSTLTTICVFLPMIFTTGMVRELMLPFALTITFALLASLFVALTVVPAMGSVVFKKAIPKEWGFFEKMKSGYGFLLDKCLRFKIIPIGIAIGLLVFSVWGVLRMGIILLPTMASDELMVTVEMEDDLTREECYAKADDISDRILSAEGVDSVGIMTNLANILSSNLAAAADDYTKYTCYITLDDNVSTEQGLKDTKANVEAALEGVTECEISVEEDGSGAMSDFLSSGLTINIYGKDNDTLIDISEDVMSIIEEAGGFEEISNDQEEADEVIHLVIDRKKAAKYSLTVAQIYSELYSKIDNEKSATTLVMDEGEIDVTILDERDALTLDNILDTEFEYTQKDDDGNEETKTVKLSKFAEIKKETGAATISSENGTHMIEVTASTREGYNTTKATEAIEEKLLSYDLPEGYTIDTGGEVEQVRNMMGQLMLMIALGLALVYLIMVAQFQSFLGPFIILFTVPLAFTGGFLGLLLSGDILSIVSMLGFVVLMGTVVNNGIVFVDYVNQLRIDGVEKHEALIRAGKTRMRPILMTALTTILAMITMVLSSSFSAALTRSMAVVVAGGLAYATLMTLFIVPVMYDILYRKKPKAVNVDFNIEDAPKEDSADV